MTILEIIIWLAVGVLLATFPSEIIKGDADE